MPMIMLGRKEVIEGTADLFVVGLHRSTYSTSFCAAGFPITESHTKNPTRLAAARWMRFEHRLEEKKVPTAAREDDVRGGYCGRPLRVRRP